MNDETLLGRWIRRFLLEHLVGERNLARVILLHENRPVVTAPRIVRRVVEKLNPRQVRARQRAELPCPRLTRHRAVDPHGFKPADLRDNLGEFFRDRAEVPRPRRAAVRP